MELKQLLFSISLFICLSSCGDSPQLMPLSSDDVILAFGDSLTFGTGAKKSESYPIVLAKLSGRKVVNAGVPGEISAEGLARLPSFLEKHQPALLILCHGGNDILQRKNKDAMFSNVRKMVELAQAQNIEVILLGVPEFGLFLSAMEGYGDVASETNIVYLPDLISDLLGDNSLKSDTVHPNKAGYKIMAETIYESLQESGAL